MILYAKPSKKASEVMAIILREQLAATDPRDRETRQELIDAICKIEVDKYFSERRK